MGFLVVVVSDMGGRMKHHNKKKKKIKIKIKREKKK